MSEELESSPPHAEEQKEACALEDQAARRQEQEEAERLRLEEEQARREAEEAERQMRREQEEAIERDRHEREEAAARAEAARQAEADRLRDRNAVSAFLKEHGYSDVVAPKRTMLKTKYPIHTAAKVGDARVVAALLKEGADPAQKTSAGKTALQVAQWMNRKGSHANVLRVLGGA